MPESEGFSSCRGGTSLVPDHAELRGIEIRRCYHISIDPEYRGQVTTSLQLLLAVAIELLICRDGLWVL